MRVSQIGKAGGIAICSALLLVSATGACAEPATQLKRALDECARVSKPELRIDCLEKALAIAYGESAATSTSVDSTPPPDAVAPLHEDPPEPVAERREPEDARQLGAEQVAARTARRNAPGEGASLLAGVAAIAVVPYHRLEVHLDNGQVWRQITGDTQRITVRGDENLSAEISEARLGGYQLRLRELGRTIRVERIR